MLYEPASAEKIALNMLLLGSAKISMFFFLWREMMTNLGPIVMR
jgi:hypothetical protein